MFIDKCKKILLKSFAYFLLSNCMCFLFTFLPVVFQTQSASDVKVFSLSVLLKVLLLDEVGCLLPHWEFLWIAQEKEFSETWM